MSGAHLEYIGPYHWRLTGTTTVDIRRIEEIEPNLSIVNRWLVEPHDCERVGGPGNWKLAADALAHAFSLATRDENGELSVPILKAIEQGKSKRAMKHVMNDVFGKFARP